MFCPVGFTPISRLLDRIPESHFRQSFDLAAELCIAVSEDNDAAQLQQFYSVAPADWVEFNFLASFSDQAYIASPAGDVLRLDLRAVRSVFFDLEVSVRTLEEMDKHLPKHLLKAFRLFDFPSSDFAHEYQNFAPPPKTRNPWQLAEELGLDSHHHFLPTFFERNGYTICLQAFDFLERLNTLDLSSYSEMAGMLRQFEGHALCVPDEFAQTEWAKYWPQIAVEGARGKSIGRPPIKIQKAIEAYARLYPDGCEGHTWLQVLKRVTHDIGLDVSLDTLQRAVKQVEEKRAAPQNQQN